MNSFYSDMGVRQMQDIPHSHKSNGGERIEEVSEERLTF